MAQTGSDFTRGRLFSQLIRFSFPFFLTNLVQAFYNIADIMVIYRFCGSEGIAGVSIGGNITMTVTFSIIGLCNGGAIMVAQYCGMKSEKDVTETISTTMGIMLILSLLTTAVMLVFPDPLLRAVNTPREAFSATKTYMMICVSGIVFIFGYNTIFAILRGLGDSRTPMYFGVCSCLLNITLDLLLTGALKLEVAGAAAATVISQAAALVGCVLYLRGRNRYFVFSPSGFRIFPRKVGMILRLGVPGAIQSAIVSGGFLIVSSITNKLGVTAASAVAVAGKVNNFAQMPAEAFGTVAGSMIGQNVGAGKYDRARSVLKSSIFVSLCIGSVMFILVQLIPSFWMGLLVADADVIKTAVPYLRVTAFDYLLVALVFPLNALCNGSGHTMFTMIPSIASSVVFRVPVAYFCVNVLHRGLAGVGISTPVGTLSAIIICAAYDFSGRWCNTMIVKEEQD